MLSLGILIVLAVAVVFAESMKYAGSVGGTVLNEQSNPIEGATLVADPTDRGLAYSLPRAISDKAGHFSIRNLWWGKFCGLWEEGER